MKNIFLLLLFLISSFSFAQNEKLNDDKAKKIQNVIRLFKNKDVKGISEIVRYPLSREYPITDVKNKQEFVKRFNHIFDKSVVDLISKSKMTDWVEVDWRGIMLGNGVMWVDIDGKIIALNHQSDFEKKERSRLISDQKNRVHSSLKVFKEPIYKFRTKNYIIRIDELENGFYRYASWKNTQSESLKPELFLKNGTVDYSGSGGNHTFTFKNGDYIYKIYRNIIGADDTPEINLYIEHNNKMILAEEGELLEK